ncbi:MAG: cytidyltransferase [Candidatus Dadabacteria bacterium]|nr:MAG: cytidyltransferase [Candidatus Dadabacteria bacterium]
MALEGLPERKIKTLDEISLLAKGWKEDGRKIVHCHGVFDLVHLGHVRHLRSAKSYGDILVVSVTSDRFVKRGPGRPVFKEAYRAEALASLEVVDYVCILDFPTAVEGIKAIKPDFYVKGPDYKEKEKDLTGKIIEEEQAIKAHGGEIVFTEDITFSSSRLINNYLDAYPRETLQYLKGIAEKYTVESIADMLRGIDPLKIVIVGDAIIDQYYYCSPMGKSSKASIVAQRYESDENFAGGSLATANHVAQICSNVRLISLLGEERSYGAFINEMLNPYIETHFVKVPDAVTTVKRRYVELGTNTKLFEVCFLDDSGLSEEVEDDLLGLLSDTISEADVVIVSDFGHGMITPSVMETLCEKSHCLAINVQTNSANAGFNLVTKFRRADMVCIDERELRLALHDRYSPLKDLVVQVSDRLGCKLVIITRGKEGSLSYSKEEGFIATPAFAGSSVDIVGAGDAFFSYAAPCFAAGFPSDLIGLIGNAAGSIAVQIVGNREPVKYVDLIKFIGRLLKV